MRLWGCNLACSFCDTDFESNPNLYSIAELLLRAEDAELVVLTGGEPLRQNIVPLVSALHDDGHTIQIETAGTLWWNGLEDIASCNIVVSPKTRFIHERITQHADYFKYIVSASDARLADGLPVTNTQRTGVHPQPLARPPVTTSPEHVFVQPMDEADESKNRLNMNLCVELALKHGYRISIQQHKIMGVP
jgi:organic radical activating enzyme